MYSLVHCEQYISAAALSDPVDYFHAVGTTTHLSDVKIATSSSHSETTVLTARPLALVSNACAAAMRPVRADLHSYLALPSPEISHDPPSSTLQLSRMRKENSSDWPPALKGTIHQLQEKQIL